MIKPDSFALLTSRPNYEIIVDEAYHKRSLFVNIRKSGFSLFLVDNHMVWMNWSDKGSSSRRRRAYALRLVSPSPYEGKGQACPELVEWRVGRRVRQTVGHVL